MTLTEEQSYFEAISVLENNVLTEDILSTLSPKTKSKLSFFRAFAKSAGKDVLKMIEFFKNVKIFKFFKAVKFSMVLLYKKLKLGFKAYQELLNVVAEYLASTKIVKFTEKHMKSFDLFLEKHPIAKKMTGIVVGGILLYIWLNMSFSGDFSYDFSFEDMISAVQGTFTLHELFAGTEGVKMLTLFFIGVGTGLSFPWPGAQSTQLAVGLATSLSKIIRMKYSLFEADMYTFRGFINASRR